MAYGEGVGVEVSENADSNSWYSLRFFRGVVRSALKVEKKKKKARDIDTAIPIKCLMQ